MSRELFERCLIMVLENEGGYVSPERAKSIADHGGETNLGITEVTLRRLGIDLKPSEVTYEIAKDIYYEHYWKPVAFAADLYPGLTLAMFDAEVQHGRGVKFLQQALEVTADGIPGPKTKAALTAAVQASVIGLLLDYHRQRRQLMTRWLQQDVKRLQLTFGVIDRVDRVCRAAWTLELGR